MTMTAWDKLSSLEMPWPFIEPTLRALRLARSTLSIPCDRECSLGGAAFARDSRGLGESETTDLELSRGNNPLRTLDLSALSNPGRADPGRRRHSIALRKALAQYARAFLQYVNGGGQDVRRLPSHRRRQLGPRLCGLCLNAAALGEPVAAIVPGYGVADVVPAVTGRLVRLRPPFHGSRLCRKCSPIRAPRNSQHGRGLHMMSAPHATAEQRCPSVPAPAADGT